MRIERVAEPANDVLEALARLLPQLSPGLVGPSHEQLAEIVSAPGTVLLIARDDDQVVGTLTLLLYRLPAGFRGWIHDVVVDEEARGHGVGEALTLEALAIASAGGVERVDLTTRRHREAAHRLYERLGFVQRESDVYVWRPG
ncbi:MAG: GNAT family N-acetyltransferase [Gaiellaceae bacterium]